MKILLENVYATIIDCPEEVKESLDKVMCYDIPNAKFIRQHKLEELDKKLDKARDIHEMRAVKKDIDYWVSEWTGKVHLFDKKTNRFPSGLMYLLEGFYYDEIEEIINQCDIPDTLDHIPWKNEIVLEQYQRDAQEEMAELDYRCVLYAATGSGKTVMAINVIRLLSVPTIVIVPNLTLLRQWIKQFTWFLEVSLPEDKEKGYRLIHDHQNKPRILITTVPFLYNVFYDKRESTAKRNEMYRKFVRDAGMIIYDECHRAASAQSEAVLRAVQAYYRLGLTATPDMRSDKTDLVYHAFLGPNVGKITRTKMVEEGRGVMPTVRFVRISPRSYPRGWSYQNIYDDYVCDNEGRDEEILKEAILLTKEGKVLVLVDRIEHAKKLGRKYDDKNISYTFGEDPKREEKFNNWMNGNTDILICTTQLVGEGFDFPELSGMVLAGSWKSETRTIQAIGRLMRKAANKHQAVFVDFANNCRYLYEHTIARATYWYKDGFQLDVKGTFLENIIKTTNLSELEEDINTPKQ